MRHMGSLNTHLQDVCKYIGMSVHLGTGECLYGRHLQGLYRHSAISSELKMLHVRESWPMNVINPYYEVR